MQKKILVIGGTRYFGILLVRALLEAGHHVTVATRGQTPDGFGDAVRRITLDRRNAAQMRAAFRHGPYYDLVYDQMCYSPLDAAIALDALASKVGRYIMASTIEVYRPLLGTLHRPFSEGDVDLASVNVELDLPWHEATFAETHYGEGKRQAEAVLLRQSSVPVVTVRIAHVLGGLQDFTGRLAHYVHLARQGAPLRHHVAAGPSSFINPQSISAFLAWVGTQSFVGPVNAACGEPLSAPALYRAVGAAFGTVVRTQAMDATAQAAQDGGPFDYAAPYAMDTQRAKTLGYRFGAVSDWLGVLVALHDASAVGLAAV